MPKNPGINRKKDVPGYDEKLPGQEFPSKPGNTKNKNQKAQQKSQRSVSNGIINLAELSDEELKLFEKKYLEICDQKTGE